MINLKTYESFSTNIEQVFIDCKPFIEELKGCNGRLLFRYVNIDIPVIKKTISPTSRKPVDISPDLHNKMNIEFNKRFGWNVRDGVFCYLQNPIHADRYQTYIMFPIGEYKYCWSPEVWDLYLYQGSDLYNEEDMLSLIDTYYDDDMCMADDDKELSFKCDSYYLVNQDYTDKILYEILK